MAHDCPFARTAEDCDTCVCRDPPACLKGYAEKYLYFALMGVLVVLIVIVAAYSWGNYTSVLKAMGTFF